MSIAILCRLPTRTRPAPPEAAAVSTATGRYLHAHRRRRGLQVIAASHANSAASHAESSRPPAGQLGRGKLGLSAHCPGRKDTQRSRAVALPRWPEPEHEAYGGWPMPAHGQPGAVGLGRRGSGPVAQCLLRATMLNGNVCVFATTTLVDGTAAAPLSATPAPVPSTALCRFTVRARGQGGAAPHLAHFQGLREPSRRVGPRSPARLGTGRDPGSLPSRAAWGARPLHLEARRTVRLGPACASPPPGLAVHSAVPKGAPAGAGSLPALPTPVHATHVTYRQCERRTRTCPSDPPASSFFPSPSPHFLAAPF